ncbi:MAG: hypothetical protein AAFP70_19375, partial [Calditrichota bacterium]
VMGETLNARILLGRKNGDEARLFALSSTGKTLLKKLNNYMGSVDIKLKNTSGVLFYLVEFDSGVEGQQDPEKGQGTEVAIK